VLAAYASWVAKVQNQSDPNNIDVRTEPKFEIPSGAPYQGGWCRPQTDGPGLRSNALAMWGKILLANNQEDEAKNVLNLVARDLEWIQNNWETEGCDLWEEFRSNDFFWGRSAFVSAFSNGADLASKLNRNDLKQTYTDLGNTIKNSIMSTHFNGEYIYGAHGRDVDGSVIHAVITFGDNLYTPSSTEVAKTIQKFNEVFCNEYAINQQDNQNNVPGILYGRYPNDSYAGGNPWQLLTASLAECFYKAASEFYQEKDQS